MSVIPVKDTLKYINEARTNPSGFAKYVKKELDQFISPTSLPLYPGCNYSTNEGKSAWNEAYQFLLKQKPLPAYELNEGLNLAAQDHAIDMAKTNIFGHNSSDGRSFSDRITKRCGKAFGSSGENIGSDFKVQGRDHALQTILGLIIDDGVSSRGHRKNIFSNDFKYVGIASRVQEDKIITVIDFHSAKLPTINGTNNTNNVEGNLTYQQPMPMGGGWGTDFDSGFENFQSKGFGGKKQFFQGSGFEKEDDDFGEGMGGFGGGFGGKFAGIQHDKGFMEGMKGYGNFSGGFGGKMSTGGSSGSGGRYVASKSTSTKTSTVNGVKKTIKTTKIKYSDGTEEEQVQETTSH